MKVRIQCPHCNEVIPVPVEFAGKKGKCPSCGQVFKIPANLAPPPPSQLYPPSQPSNIYDAEDARSELSPLTDPTGMEMASQGNLGVAGSPAENDLGYGLSSGLLQELDRQPKMVVRVPCPVCREQIVQGAAKCHHCGVIFHPGMNACRNSGRASKWSLDGIGRIITSRKTSSMSLAVAVVIVVVRVTIKILQYNQ